MKKSLLLFLIILLQVACTTGNRVDKKNKSIDNITYLKDDNFTYAKIIKKNFIPLKNDKISYKNGTYWFKVSLTDKTKKYNQLIFQVQEPSISLISIYNTNGIIDSKESTIENPTISFTVNNNLNALYYLKVVFKRQVHFPLHIYSSEEFIKREEKKNLGFGLYYGLASMVIILNLIFFISLKDKSFLFYSAFLACINLSFTGFDGVLYFFFYPKYFDLFIIFCHFLIQIFGAMFASNFLNLKEYYPKMNIIGYLSLFIPALFYILFFSTNNFLYCAIADLLGLLLLSYYWVLGVLMIKKEEFAKFFVIGYSMILFFGIFYLIPLNFGISSISVTFTQLKLGALFEMLVLTFAITYRIKKLREENNIYRDELKVYLEEIYGLKKELKSEKNKSHESFLINKVNSLKQNFNLTDREVDILLKITEGFSNNEIAEKLFISINTVKYHTKNLYEKLDVKKRTEVSSKLIFDKKAL